ncbi:hypothetical protein I4F81_005861 [Pyropia yezoensis]|uniref:Uncharacterized protein n=1 Tax=Pyropia yezoensis TaxID=2788 RepID=A0ACC3BZM0_PYRYE|nr:hypothetical protein I4F81_005861 [Neopyropia yezoensis]
MTAPYPIGHSPAPATDTPPRMGTQSPPGGLIYLMEGAGSAGGATAGYAAYGAGRELPGVRPPLQRQRHAGAAGRGHASRL